MRPYRREWQNMGRFYRLSRRLHPSGPHSGERDIRVFQVLRLPGWMCEFPEIPTQDAYESHAAIQ